MGSRPESAQLSDVPQQATPPVHSPPVLAQLVRPTADAEDSESAKIKDWYSIVCV